MPKISARRELFWIALLVVCTYWAAVQLDLFEIWHAWAREWEVFELDEILLVSSLASLVLLGLSVRRQRAYRTEVQRRREAQAQLEHSIALKSLFLASMSHEIRTPMTGVIGIVDLLEYSAQDPDQKELLQTLRFSSKSLLRIINNLLDFSKLDAGALELSAEPFSPREEVGRVLELFGANAEAKGVLLFGRFSPQVPEQFSGDAARITQVLTNLVGNALKFTTQGEVEIRMDYAEAVGLKVCVRDTGGGIEPEALERIFESYAQAGDKADGTGLGLTICKGLVEAMGGTIEALSKPGQGASFRFELPLKLLQPAPAVPEPSQRWILVEPHQGLFEAARGDLAPLGIEVFQAHDLSQIEALLADKEPTKVVFEGWFSLSRSVEMARAVKQNHRHLECCLICGRRQKPESNHLFERVIHHPLTGRQWSTALGPVKQQPGVQGGLLKVLVVDDDRISRMTLARYLQGEGLEVILAETGEQALELCQSEQPQLALIDLRLPGIKGDELAQRIQGAGAPYLVCCSSADVEQVRPLIRSGTFSDFLPKPLDRAQLLRRLPQWSAAVRGGTR